MQAYKIGVLPGDDIGLEIVPATVKVMQAAAEKFSLNIDWLDLPIGYPSYLKTGETFPQSTLDTLYTLDGWVLGPIGHKEYPKDEKAVNPHPIIRRKFELHSNIRPTKSYPSLKTLQNNVDVVIVRENNEGFQPDRNVFKGSGEFMPNPDMAISVRVITRNNSQFVAKSAFDLARQRNKLKKVTIVHKSSVYKLGCGLFLESCEQIAQNYPDISYEEINVDTFAMHLLMRPQDFDVIVTTNMFGDILSDEAAGLVGGLGMAPGLCVGPKYAMAQATHGSAPDIAGKGIANPYAMIVSGAMLLSWLGNKHSDSAAIKAGDKIMEAIEKVITNNEDLTPDLGGKGSTEKMGEAIVNRIIND